VRVAGLQSRPELNGKQGSLHEFDQEQRRWKVVMDDGSGLALRAGNLAPMGEASSIPAAAAREDTAPSEAGAAGADVGAVASAAASAAAVAAGVAAEGLRPGLRIRVRGLRSRPELNGCEGCVVEFDQELSRWRTLLDDGTGLSLKPEALEVIEEPTIAARAPIDAGESNEAEQTGAAAGSVAGLLPGARVRLRSLTSRPDLNGQQGSLVEFEAEHGRWKVILDDGSGLALRPHNLEPMGTSSSSAAAAVARDDTAPCEPTDAGPAARRQPETKTVAAAGAAAEGLRPGLRVLVRGLRSRPELNGCEGSVVEFDPELSRWRTLLDDGTGLSLKPESLEDHR